jgi:hypothetical protein
MGQELARHDDLYAVTFGVGLAADVEREINRAHNAVAELLMDQFLDRCPIDGDDLIPAVDQRVGWNRGWDGPFVGRDLQPGDSLVGQRKDRANAGISLALIAFYGVFFRLGGPFPGLWTYSSPQATTRIKL